jgi:hypothetical protein
MAKKPKSPAEIASIRHKKDTRVNIPTEELRDFVAEDEDPGMTSTMRGTVVRGRLNEHSQL